MTGLELAPILYALPVAMAMFANGERHSTMEKISRRQRRHQQRSSAWLQHELSNESGRGHQRTATRTPQRMELQQHSLASPSLPTSTSIVIEMDDEIETSLSVEMTLEDYHQS
jgi:hypothetical protein